MSKKIDPKILGIPNICFSLTKNNDKRELIYKKQRLKRGFDDSELWSLCNTIAKFTIPRLKEYISITESYIVISNKRKKQIKSLLRALELIERDEGSWVFTPEENKEVDKGLKNFHKIFMSLWY